MVVTVGRFLKNDDALGSGSGRANRAQAGRALASLEGGGDGVCDASACRRAVFRRLLRRATWLFS